MATIKWIDSNGNWITSPDWGGGVVPGPGDDAVIDLPGVYTVSITSTINVGSIAINATGASLSVNDPVGTGTVASNLSNSGPRSLTGSVGKVAAAWKSAAH